MTGKRKKKIKFLTIYNTFSKAEKTEFHIFLKSNQSARKRDYEGILSSLKINELGIIDFDETKSSITRWNILSELNLHAENFLIIKTLESENSIKKNLLLKAFEVRNLHSPFEQRYKAFKKDIINKPFVNYDYDNFYKLDLSYLKFQSSNSLSKNNFKKLSDIQNSRMGVVLSEMLEMLLHRKVHKITKQINSDSLVEELSSVINFDKALVYLSDSSNYSNKLYHIIEFLYLLHKCFNDPADKKSYIKAKKIFSVNLRSVAKEKRVDYYELLINFNIECINLLIPGAYEELFSLIKEKLDEGIIHELENSNFVSNHFRNYVIVGLTLKKFKWTNNFLNKYGPALPAKLRNANVLIGKASLMFAKKEYAQCFETIKKIKKINSYFFVDISVLKLKVLFELNKIVECHDELRKLKEFLRKDRLVVDYLIIYTRAFCKAFSLLLKLKENPISKNLNDLMVLYSDKNFIGKNWIIKKAGDVKINRS
ncbi:MAG TPA: hypothetical protein PKD83_09950 [Ignavibacteria bacterium]|nr:hypothetical protein [Ignavibacteria bacterium]